MTYLEFHLVFILPPIVALALGQARPLAGVGARLALGRLALVAVIAVAWTTPWDNYLVYRGVWGYGGGRVLGTLGYVPVEEYAFFALQPALTGLFYYALRGRPGLASAPTELPPGLRTGTAVALGLAAVVGLGLVGVGPERALYLGLILVWAAPVLAGMALVGAENVWRDRRRVGWATALPTVYLWVADRVALDQGVWSIADGTRLGVDPLGLPVEEATFFLATNALCVAALAMLLPDPSDVVAPGGSAFVGPAAP